MPSHSRSGRYLHLRFRLRFLFLSSFIAAGIELLCPAAPPVIASSSNPFLLPSGQVSVQWNGSAYAVTMTPLSDGQGATVVHFSLTDGTALAPLVSRFEQSGLDVPLPPPAPPNTPPVVVGMANQIIPEDSTAVTVPVSIADAESPASTLTVSAAADDVSLVPDENLSVGGSGQTRTLTIYPRPSRSGITEVKVIVSDGQLSTTASFVLTITPDIQADNKLRLLSIAPLNHGMRINWSSVPGETYQVLAKDRLDQNYWTLMNSSVIAYGTNTTWADFSTAAGSTRFYVVRNTSVSFSPSPSRILAAVPNSSGGVNIQWSSQPGASYRVFAKEGLEVSVSIPISQILVATGGVTSWTDPDAWLYPVQFYRVESLP
jgi:hypothetical protein